MKGYYCTCDSGKNEKGDSRLTLTVVTLEEICVHCGHYATYKEFEAPKSLRPVEYFDNYELHVELFKPKAASRD